MAARSQIRVINAAGLVPGIVLVTFPAASTIFTSARYYGLSSAFYQLGYGSAAFGVGPLQAAGVTLSTIFSGTAIVAAAMAVLSIPVARRRKAR